jgi:hypothetical protein
VTKAIVLGAALTYAVALLARLLLPSFYPPDTPLEPYVTVVTDLDHDDAAEALLGAGATEVITPSTTGVSVSRFRSVEVVPLGEALASLDPLDPRRDPWIERLGAYFTIDGRNVVYARLDQPLGHAGRTVRRALGSRSRIAEWSPFGTFSSLLVFAAAAAIVIAGHRRGRLVRVVAALPWIPAVAAVRLAGAVFAAVGLLLTGWVAEELGRLRDRGGLRTALVTRAFGSRALVFLAGHLLSFVYVTRLTGLAGAAILSLAALGSVAGVVALVFGVVRRIDPDHRPFEPVSIIAGGTGRFVDGRWARVALLLLPLVLLAPPILDVVVPAGAVARPVPRPVGDADLGYDGLSALWMAGGDERLPDLADYLAHRAYQEGLVYGREYGFPVLDERVELSRVREEPDGSYSSYRETQFAYDAEWVEHALEVAPAGIARLLVGLGYAAGVVLSPSDALYSGYSQLIQHLAYVVLVLAPFLFAALPWARPTRTRGSIPELARRRRQVA